MLGLKDILNACPPERLRAIQQTVGMKRPPAWMASQPRTVQLAHTLTDPTRLRHSISQLDALEHQVFRHLLIQGGPLKAEALTRTIPEAPKAIERY